MRLLRNCLLVSAAWFVCSSPHVAQASPIAFSGTFSQDNDVFQQLVDVLSPSTFTAQTTSYASGGFDPILTLYGPSGTNLLANLLSNDDRDSAAATSTRSSSLLLSCRACTCWW